jgi:hypothetical protein
MTPQLSPDLELDLPDGRGVDLPPPVLPLPDYWSWLEVMHEDRVRRGVLQALSEEPRRQPSPIPFRLD